MIGNWSESLSKHDPSKKICKYNYSNNANYQHPSDETSTCTMFKALIA